jgi:hypothetical protein
MNPKALKGRWRLELLEDEKMDWGAARF